MTDFIMRSSSDGVPILEVVSKGIPGEAGDVALVQGRLDAEYGVYRPHLFEGFAQKIYDQGFQEVTRSPPRIIREPGPSRNPDCPTREDFLPYCDPCTQPLCGDVVVSDCPPIPCPSDTPTGRWQRQQNPRPSASGGQCPPGYGLRDSVFIVDGTLRDFVDCVPVRSHPRTAYRRDLRRVRRNAALVESRRKVGGIF